MANRIDLSALSLAQVRDIMTSYETLVGAAHDANNTLLAIAPPEKPLANACNPHGSTLSDPPITTLSRIITH